MNLNYLTPPVIKPFHLLIVAVMGWLLLFSTQSSADEPVEVDISLKVQQITNIDQKAENFGVVAMMIFRWNEPELAAKPGEKIPQHRMYPALKFVNLLTDRGLKWPAHSFYNMQGRIDYQTRGVMIDREGNIIYVARFTATFQAPDFDFTHFPLDKQIFYLKVDMLPPVTEFVFNPVK